MRYVQLEHKGIGENVNAVACEIVQVNNSCCETSFDDAYDDESESGSGSGNDDVKGIGSNYVGGGVVKVNRDPLHNCVGGGVVKVNRGVVYLFLYKTVVLRASKILIAVDGHIVVKVSYHDGDMDQQPQEEDYAGVNRQVSLEYGPDCDDSDYDSFLSVRQLEQLEQVLSPQLVEVVCGVAEIENWNVTWRMPQ